MSFRVQGTISVNGTQAKAEAKAVATELRKVGTEATGMSRASGAAGDGARRLGAGADAAARDLRALAAAERQAATDAVGMGRSHTIAAGGVANLTAQFNDIGVMLAAGQNPLQLAIQQGTQITQVFGTMGAASAARALGQAFLSMVSPLNLITIGSIAAGAALFQWLSDAGEEVLTLDDRLEALASGVDAYAKSAKAARAPSSELAEVYGLMAREARAANEAIAEGERLKASRAIAGEASAQSLTFGGFEGQQGDIIGSEREETLRRIRTELGVTGAAAVDVAAKLEALGVASGPEAVARAALAARDAIIEAGVAADNSLAESLATLAERASAYVGVMTDGAVDSALASQYQLMGQTRAESDAAVVAAQEMVGTLQAEAAERYNIVLFGRDSELVAQNRLAAEREILAAQMEAEGVAAALAAQVLAAWDAATGFNAEASGMPGFLSAAAGAAAGIAGNIWNAVAGMVALRAEQARAKIYASFGDDERGSQRAGNDVGQLRANEALAVANRRAAQLRVSNMGGGTKGGRSGGGAAAAREESDAVAELIEKLQDEIALEREMDPVKKEMIRYRDQLKEATAAERAEVEALIVQREREKAATESLKWVGEQTGDALIDALMGAGDAGERLIETLKRAVLQALLLGNGPLAGLFGGGLFGGGGGGGGGGGLFGLFSGPSTGSLGLPFADGGDPHEKAGMVYGVGGPRDDKVRALISPGEFIVNARAARRNRSLLERLNAGPAFADGGMVGGSGFAGAGGGGARDVAVRLYVDRGGDWQAEVRRVAGGVAAEVMEGGMEEWSRTALPGRVQQISQRPWQKG